MHVRMYVCVYVCLRIVVVDDDDDDAVTGSIC